MTIQTAVKPASILCVGNRWFPKAPGGAERYVYELMQQFVKRGDRVEFCAIDLPKTCDDASLVLTQLASAQGSLPQRLWESRIKFQHRTLTSPDAINLHFALYSFPLLHQLPADVPVTFNFHGPWALESQQEGESKIAVQMKQWLEQQVYRRCDRFIVLSKAFGEILHQRYHISWKNIHVIPGGVDSQRFQSHLSRSHARQILNFPQDRFILFTPRRLVHRMGLDKLLLAMAQIKQHIPDIWLAIAGKGLLLKSLEQQVEALGLQNQVCFLGFLPDEKLPIAYQAADLTIVPSQSLEGFGLILLESLASGTPVLSTPVGGMPEVLRPFCPELVTEATGERAIAQRLREFIMEQLPLPNRETCREYAVTHFDWSIISRQVREALLAPIV